MWCQLYVLQDRMLEEHVSSKSALYILHPHNCQVIWRDQIQHGYFLFLNTLQWLILHNYCTRDQRWCNIDLININKAQVPWGLISLLFQSEMEWLDIVKEFCRILAEGLAHIAVRLLEQYFFPNVGD